MSTKINLICLPYAGAGASIFFQWRQTGIENMNIICPELAGKDKRFNEPLYESIEQEISDITNQLSKNCDCSNQPTVFFGHSFGAILAYELARFFEKNFGNNHLGLLVSGSPAPTLKRRGDVTHLSDSEFLAGVEKLAGYKHPALEDEMLRELFLPVIRRDVELHETYVHKWKEKSNIPVVCLYGNSDHLVNDEEALAWRDITSNDLKIKKVAGGHMFWLDDLNLIFQEIKELAIKIAEQ